MTGLDKDQQPAEPAAEPSAESTVELVAVPRHGRYNLLVVIVTVAVMGVAGLAYTNYVQHRSDTRYRHLLADQARREQAIRDERDKAAATARATGLKLFCEWVRAQIDPELGPPTTGRGEKILAANRLFYTKIGCGKAP